MLLAAGYQYRHPHARRALSAAVGSWVRTTSSWSAPAWPRLRAAGLLHARGLDVLLLDAADRPGGQVATGDRARCDRGFQVSTPPTRRCGPPPIWTHSSCAFEPGAAVRGADGRLHVLAHPVRRPGLIWRTAADELLRPLGKAALTAWTARVLASARPGRHS